MFTHTSSIGFLIASDLRLLPTHTLTWYWIDWSPVSFLSPHGLPLLASLLLLVSASPQTPLLLKNIIMITIFSHYFKAKKKTPQLIALFTYNYVTAYGLYTMCVCWSLFLFSNIKLCARRTLGCFKQIKITCWCFFIASSFNLCKAKWYRRKNVANLLCKYRRPHWKSDQSTFQVDEFNTDTAKSF